MDYILDNTIMIVDDEEEIIESLEEFLTGVVSVIKSAPNGKVALEMLKIVKVDLVAMDIKMPEMGGLTLLKLIKEKYPQIKCLVMSGHADKEKVKKALQLGAYDFFE